MECIPEPVDLCINIAGIQNPVPAGMTSYPGGYCCTDPQVWDTVRGSCQAPLDPTDVTCSGAPNPASTGTLVTWSGIVNGGTAPYTYVWSGTDGLSGANISTTKTYNTTGQKLAFITVTA
jgi:hypothetical protein